MSKLPHPAKANVVIAVMMMNLATLEQISSFTYCCTRQDDPELGELAGLRIDLNRPAMLLDDDVVADREAKPGAFASWLGCEERVEQFVFHLGRNAGAVVANPDLDAIPEALGRGSKRWLVVAAICFRFALGRRVKAV
jgi:hypothetical protein